MSGTLDPLSVRLLDELEAAVQGRPRDSEERALPIDLRRRCLEPLRVAIVGQIKAGKSTLMNALVEEDLLPTGTTETTYNVTWLRHGPTATARIWWSDGRPVTQVAIGELAAFAQRIGARDEADHVAWLEVFAPLDILRQVELIDTPGLGSSHGRDSHKTMLFLNLDRTGAPTPVDVAAFMLRRGMHEQDAAAIRSFRNRCEGRLSPVNALALMAQVDLLWPGTPHPFEAAGGVAQRLMRQPDLASTLYEILPISAALARGLATVGETEKVALRALSALPPEVLEKGLASAARFTGVQAAFDDIRAEDRRGLVRKLGLYGVSQVCRRVQAAGLERALAQTLEESGVPALRRQLLEDLGPRAAFVRLSNARPQLDEIAARLAREGGGTAEGQAWRAALDRYFESSEVMGLELLHLATRDDLDLSPAEALEIRETARAGVRATRGYEDRRAYWRARFNEARLLGSPAEAISRLMCRRLEISDPSTAQACP